MDFRTYYTHISINKTCERKLLDLEEKFAQTFCFISEASVSHKYQAEANETYGFKAFTEIYDQVPI